MQLETTKFYLHKEKSMNIFDMKVPYLYFYFALDTFLKELTFKTSQRFDARENETQIGR